MALTTADPQRARDSLVDAILRFLGGGKLLASVEARQALQAEVDAAGPEGVAALKARLMADHGWSFYEPDPLARRMHYALANRFLLPASRAEGLSYLERAGNAPLVIFSNHLSYSDANVIQVLLHRAGQSALAERLTAIAGPKIFTSRERRFSSLCFGTIKVPQSTEVSSGEAVLDVREVARAAKQSIETARDRLRAGDALLLFGEGTRSRTARMQPMLPGVARYLDVPGTWILPVGLTGPELFFPVENTSPRPAELCLRIGEPFPAASLLEAAGGDRRAAVDAVGVAIADVLPEPYRGAYGASEDTAGARAILDRARSGPATRSSSRTPA